LLGYDCKYRKVDGKEQTDFYGKNRHHARHTLYSCNIGLKWMSKDIEKYKRNVISCSDHQSIIMSLVPQKFNKVLENLPIGKGQDYYKSKLAPSRKGVKENKTDLEPVFISDYSI